MGVKRRKKIISRKWVIILGILVLLIAIRRVLPRIVLLKPQIIQIFSGNKKKDEENENKNKEDNNK